MFGRSNRSVNGEYANFGKSGNVIQEGAGLRDQMEYGNVSYYNTFSLKLITDLLFELSAGVLGFDERRFVMETGERGAAQFSEAVRNSIANGKKFLLIIILQLYRKYQVNYILML